jgi:hypothetical protein
MKTLLVCVIIIIAVAIISAGGYFAYQYFATPKTNQTMNQILCEDSDNGKDLYTKGTVEFSEPMNIKEGAVLRVISNKSVLWNSDKGETEIILGQEKSLNAYDDVYYLKQDGTNGRISVNILSDILIKKINYFGDKNQNNDIEAIKSSAMTDQCVDNILVENTCEMGINNGYLCKNGCKDGACIR